MRKQLESPRLAVVAILAVGVEVYLRAADEAFSDLWLVPVGVVIAAAAWVTAYVTAIFVMKAVQSSMAGVDRHNNAAVVATLLTLATVAVWLVGAAIR